MNRILKVVVACSLAAPLAAVAQPIAQAADQPAPMSRQQLHTLEQGSQFKQLASYYHQRETVYRAKAAEEKAEWDKRSQSSIGSAQKIPNPADSARRLYESYSYEADHSADLANHYDQLAAAQSKS